MPELPSSLADPLNCPNNNSSAAPESLQGDSGVPPQDYLTKEEEEAFWKAVESGDITVMTHTGSWPINLSMATATWDEESQTWR